ncbi:MAG: hypothetical protein NTZ48_00515 [Candidatus Omnitrophica bacterium]|nr:hypothetical protein [Candidatus Omnitrophota bacterium]
MEEKITLEFSADEAAEDNFFEERWDDLNLGIQINFEEGSFFEIRTIEGRVIVQLFRMLNKEMNEQMEEILENLHKAAKIRGFNSSAPIVFTIDLTLKPREAYTILNISREDFAVIADDFSRASDGTGKYAKSASEILPKVEALYKTFSAAIASWVINPNNLANLLLNKDTVIQAFSSALDEVNEKIRCIKEGSVKILKENVGAEMRALESLADSLSQALNLLRGESGYIVYRIFYRNYLVPFLENRRNTGKYV